MITLPIKITNGKVDVASDYSKMIEQSIRSLLMSSQGDIFFGRSYGSLVRQCLFEPISEVGIARLNYFVRETLRQEKRINVQRLEVDDSNKKNGVILINIYYNIISTNKNSNISITV